MTAAVKARATPTIIQTPDAQSADDLVGAFAAHLAVRPAQRITDPEKAMVYFRGDARRRLAMQDDFMARRFLAAQTQVETVRMVEP